MTELPDVYLLVKRSKMKLQRNTGSCPLSVINLFILILFWTLPALAHTTVFSESLDDLAPQGHVRKRWRLLQIKRREERKP